MPDPSEIRQRDETKLRRVKTMSLKKFSMTSGPKLRVSIFLRNALRPQDSRSFVQDFFKDTSG